MTTPGDESRTEEAWREIVEHYGERAVLPDEHDAPGAPGDRSATTADDLSADHPAGRPDLPDDLADDLADDPDDAEVLDARIAEAERFRPPTPPPFPRPRTWQRGLAWSGVFVAPALALLLGLLSVYVPPIVGWTLLAWFVGGFVFLVRDMPRSPRDPWDDGSRI